jgi:hypothetical protein
MLLVVLLLLVLVSEHVRGCSKLASAKRLSTSSSVAARPLPLLPLEADPPSPITPAVAAADAPRLAYLSSAAEWGATALPVGTGRVELFAAALPMSAAGGNNKSACAKRRMRPPPPLHAALPLLGAMRTLAAFCMITQGFNLNTHYHNIMRSILAHTPHVEDAFTA